MASKRVILITGASAGIGRSTSIALSKAYPSASHPEPLVLVLVGRRQAELEVTAKALREGTEVEIAVGDVGVDEDVKRIFGVVKDKYGRLDVLFNVSPVGRYCLFPVLCESNASLIQSLGTACRTRDGG